MDHLCVAHCIVFVPIALCLSVGLDVPGVAHTCSLCQTTLSWGSVGMGSEPLVGCSYSLAMRYDMVCKLRFSTVGFQNVHRKAHVCANSLHVLLIKKVSTLVSRSGYWCVPGVEGRVLCLTAPKVVALHSTFLSSGSPYLRDGDRWPSDDCGGLFSGGPFCKSATSACCHWGPLPTPA